jgi:hypothetical protein
MKKRILSIVLGLAVILVATSSYTADNISPKSREGYTLHSVIDGRQSTSAYNKNGNWIYTIEQYSIDNLDKNIIDKVQSVYSDYGVTSIQKVVQPGMEPVYVVHLENEKSIKLIRLTKDDMELVQNLTKG